VICFAHNTCECFPFIDVDLDEGNSLFCYFISCLSRL